MINTTNKIIIHQTGMELDRNIRSALALTVHAILKTNDQETLDLMQVSTRQYPTATFAKFITLGTLKTNLTLGAEYIANAFDAYQAGGMAMTQAQFDAFAFSNGYAYLAFKRTYALHIKTGIGLFLVALHSSRVITLPKVFKWPSNRTGGARTHAASNIVCANSELLSYVRSVPTEPGSKYDDSFASIGTDQKRVEWYVTHATKLLLATGWHSPEDVNFEELLKLRQADEGKSDPFVSVHSSLLVTVKRKFGKRVNIEPEEWGEALRITSAKQRGDAVVQLAIGSKKYVQAFHDVALLPPSVASPERLGKLGAHPELNFDIRSYAANWLKLEEIYLNEVRREDYRLPIMALGFLNLYLFFYLPYWFREHSQTKILFPNTPDLLAKSVFISRLQSLDVETPETFVSFMKTRQKLNNIADATAYAHLKQVEVFFEFLVEHSDELLGCKLFKKQPLSSRDYPPTPRSLGTPKRPFPRRLFPAFLSYVEAVRDYFNCINKEILKGNLDQSKIYQIIKYFGFIDTALVAKQFGIPIPAFHVGWGEGNGKIEIRYMPNPLSLGRYTLEDGRVMRLFRPHALNQILVAMYSGLRHNHIQWLDADKFDSFATQDDGDFSKLFVNTDKVMKKAWVVDVNIEVIQILRDQLEWRNLIGELGFGKQHYYNNNKKTSYPKFKPLFSYSADGLPHNDGSYASAWCDLISSFGQYICTILGSDDQRYVLSKLKPPGVDFHDLDEKRKLAEYEPLRDKPSRCVLSVRTNITPHSTRVTVVSQMVTYLPAALIGKYITGQTEATVAHYVRTDPDEMERLQVFQAREMNRRANEQQLEDFVAGAPNADMRFIKADQVNSRLAKSARKNLAETIVRYGCISISFEQDKKDGIDILKEKGIEQASLNKTEICPYGNQCPEDVIKALKGFRRCSLCPYAVRSIDHLTALGAKERQVAETLAELHLKIVQTGGKYTEEELDLLEEERQRLGEEYAGWKLCIETLEIQRQRVAAGEDTRTWVVERPEIIEQDLRRVAFPSDTTQYLLTRLQECVAYPGYLSPKLKTTFEIVKLRLLALDPSRRHEALSFNCSIDPAAECAGLIRSIAAAHKLGVSDFSKILSQDPYLDVSKKFRPKIVDQVRFITLPDTEIVENSNE